MTACRLYKHVMGQEDLAQKRKGRGVGKLAQVEMMWTETAEVGF